MPLLVLFMAAAFALAQVKVPPKLIEKHQPRYTREAFRNRVQGTVLLDMMIDEHGTPGQIEIISPLGFGLDQNAIRAVQTWRFRPATVDGKPEPYRSSVEVNFRLPGRYYDGKAEQRRTRYNKIVYTLDTGNPEQLATVTKDLEELAKKKYPPAMYLLGKLYQMGRGVPKDDSRATELITAAAAKNDPAAICETGLFALRANENEKGLKLLREASVLGNHEAQERLGIIHEGQQFGTHEPAEARRYYRLCAAAGRPTCQAALGRLLLSDPAAQPYTRHQAMAWLHLASAQVPQARKLYEANINSFTAEEQQKIADYARQLRTFR